MGKLNDIGLRLNADKSSRFHNYLDFYESVLPDCTFKGRLLEIGIMDGLSMRMWQEYYPNAEIIGLDIRDMSHLYNDPWCVPRSVKMLNVDGTDPEQLKALGMFDIIVDDGSHYMSHQQQSFKHLYYNQLNKDGVYILEDLWTSHIRFYKDAKITTLEYLKKLQKSGLEMTYFKHVHTGLGIQTIFPEYKYLDSETVAVKA